MCFHIPYRSAPFIQYHPISTRLHLPVINWKSPIFALMDLFPSLSNYPGPGRPSLPPGEHLLPSGPCSPVVLPRPPNLPGRCHFFSETRPRSPQSQNQADGEDQLWPILESNIYIYIYKKMILYKIKGPDSATSQLLPKMRHKSWSGAGKEGKTKVVEDR